MISFSIILIFLFMSFVYFRQDLQNIIQWCALYYKENLLRIEQINFIMLLLNLIFLIAFIVYFYLEIKKKKSKKQLIKKEKKSIAKTIKKSKTTKAKTEKTVKKTTKNTPKKKVKKEIK